MLSKMSEKYFIYLYLYASRKVKMPM